MATLLLSILGFFPFQGITGGVGQWLQNSNSFKYQPLGAEVTLFVGGWPLIGKEVRKDVLLLFEGGYNWGKRKELHILVGIPESPPESYKTSFTDFFLGFDVLREREVKGFSLFYGAGISWHTLRNHVWVESSKDHYWITEGKVGFSANVGFLYLLKRTFGFVGMLRYTQVASWEEFDPSRVQANLGIAFDLRRRDR